MKNGFNIVLMIIGTLLLISSCGKNNRTYTEMLNDEKKAVRKLIDSLDIKLLKEYPADGVFAENEFYQLSSGLYINVVDSGNGNRAVVGTTQVSCRFKADYINVLANITEDYDGTAMGVYPITFIYGSSAVGGNYTFLYSAGMSEPLQYVGENAVVNLIVPFKIGSQSQQQGGDPVYFKYLRYRFI